MAINVKVKLLKEMYHMELDPEAPVMDFRKEIEKHTYIAPSKSILKFQKFIFNPGAAGSDKIVPKRLKLAITLL